MAPIPRIYLDNAATSWPKPEPVYRAVESAMRDLGAPYGRGGSQQSSEVLRLVEQTRDRIAALIHAPHRRNIIFTFNCTDALCTAIFGLLQPGDHVVTSVVEHNSVLRPLQQLARTHADSICFVDCDDAGFYSPETVIKSLQSNTKMVALTQGSNVTGAIEDLSQIGQVCRARDIPFLVDAAQTIGHIDIDVRQIQCDLLAAAGHKGLLGPLGTGFLYIADHLIEQLRPLRLGGTGSSGTSPELPSEMPEKFEAGNLNVPGIIGLGAGLEFLTTTAANQLKLRSHALAENLIQQLKSLPQVKLYGPSESHSRLPIVAIGMDHINCHELAMLLDTNWGIQTRAGLHCAPKLHQRLGTDRSGGLLRVSLGLFNTDSEIELLTQAVAAISQGH